MQSGADGSTTTDAKNVDSFLASKLRNRHGNGILPAELSTRLIKKDLR